MRSDSILVQRDEASDSDWRSCCSGETVMCCNKPVHLSWQINFSSITKNSFWVAQSVGFEVRLKESRLKRQTVLSDNLYCILNRLLIDICIFFYIDWIEDKYFWFSMTFTLSFRRLFYPCLDVKWQINFHIILGFTHKLLKFLSQTKSLQGDTWYMRFLLNTFSFFF